MLTTTTNINVDFYDKKYILINAKQLDRDSRFLSVTCYNHGEIFSLNNGEHAAYVRYRKADNCGVFNNCDINNRGKIIVKLTEQMLAADGICYADLVIVNKGDAEVNSNTGEINELIANASVLSTMTFCIDVSEVPVANSDIESTHEFILLNENLERYWADFEDVMKTSKSWAVGDTGIREGEDANNSKYWSNQSEASKNAAKVSEDNAKISEDNAKASEEKAKASEVNAKVSEENAKDSEDKAKVSETNAKASEENAKDSEDNAKASKDEAREILVSIRSNENIIKSSVAIARESRDIAQASADSAKTNADRAQSYAVGGTGTRDGEDSDNSKYYYELTKNIVNEINNAFIVMGTVTFSELANAEKAAGYVYNMKEDFVTDTTFAEGAGKFYAAGTNIYCRSDGLWDCFGGASTPIATVNEVKDYLGI
jgi:flagellar biosynthesis GTPase FlhF